MKRKRRTPSPGFRLPPPFQPLTGERAPLDVAGVYAHCAMMQIAAEDTHEDYVICRGYDPRIRRFFDYDAADLANKPGLPVGKPYGSRTAGVYTVGQVFPAMIPLTRIGQTPGVAETTQGHPADLDEDVEILYDEDDKAINYMLMDAPASEGIPFRMLYDDCPPYGIIQAIYAYPQLTPKLLCSQVDATTAYQYRRGMIFINSGTEVAQNSEGICYTGEYIPVLARADPDLSPGDIVTPTDNASATDDDFKLRALEYETGWPIDERVYYPQRYVILGQGPENIGASSSPSSSPSPSEDAPTFDTYWVLNLGIDHVTIPMIFTAGVSNNFNFESGSTINGSLNFTSEQGDIYGHPTAKMLTTSSYLDPCVEFELGGTWLLNLMIQWYASDLIEPQFSSESTSVADGHSHTYDKWDGNLRGLQLEVTVTADAGGGSIRSGTLDMRQVGLQSGTSSHVMIIRGAAILVMDPDTELIIRARIYGGGVDDIAPMSTLTISETQLDCHWLCPQLRP